MVRLPVTATAFAGTPPRRVTWNDFGTWLTNAPLSPLPVRVSSSRDGLSWTKSAPSGASTETLWCCTADQLPRPSPHWTYTVRVPVAAEPPKAASARDQAIRRSMGLVRAFVRTPPAVAELLEIRSCVARADATGAGPIARRSAFVTVRPPARTKSPAATVDARDKRVASVAQPPATLTSDACQTAWPSLGSNATGRWVRFQEPG